MFRFAVMICAILLGASGCADRIAQADAPAAAAVQAPPVYRLGTDDKLKIVIYGEPQLSGEHAIGSEGMVALPLIGALKASGLTLSEFEASLTDAYRTTYVADPKISVDVIEYRPFYILGEVNKAGQYPYRVGMTVLRAVATAEGFTYRSNKKKVAIQGNDGTERIVPLTSQTPIQPGDTVRILERYF